MFSVIFSDTLIITEKKGFVKNTPRKKQSGIIYFFISEMVNSVASEEKPSLDPFMFYNQIVLHRFL